MCRVLNSDGSRGAAVLGALAHVADEPVDVFNASTIVLFFARPWPAVCQFVSDPREGRDATPGGPAGRSGSGFQPAPPADPRRPRAGMDETLHASPTAARLLGVRVRVYVVADE